jgi:hypothetical protein
LTRSLSETDGIPQFFMAELYNEGSVEDVTFGYFGMYTHTFELNLAALS